MEHSDDKEDHPLEQPEPSPRSALNSSGDGNSEDEPGMAEAVRCLKDWELGDGSSNKPAEDMVDFLVVRSRTGDEEATSILQQYMDQHVGITEKNSVEVWWCLNTPVYEKKARQAARTIFQTLLPGGKSAVLSKEAFMSGIQGHGFSKDEQKLMEKAGRVGKHEVIVEEEFVDKMMKKLGGRSNITLSGLMQNDVEWQAYKDAPLLKKVTRYPGKTAMYLVESAIDVTGKQGVTWLRSLIPTHQIYMLLIFFIYSIISVQVVLWFLPLLIFYASFTAMVVCTLQMFYSHRKLKDVGVLSDMLKRFESSLDSDTAKSTFTWNSLTPYVVFFMTLIITVATVNIADKTWIPCAELAFVSAFLTVGCFLGLSDSYDFLAMISIGLDSFSMLPMILENFPRIPGLYHIIMLFAGSLVSIEIIPGISLELGFPSFVYLIVPALFVRMAMRKSWQGTYRNLIPHLVCFFWWRMAVVFFKQASWLGMLRASVGWVLFIILLPVFAIAIIIWVLYYMSSMFTVSNMLKIVTTVVLMAIPAGIAFWAKTGYKIKGFKFDTKSTKVKAVLAFVFCLSVLPLAYIVTPPERDVNGHYVTWEQYRSLCGKPRWDQTNIAESMSLCTHLSNTMADWTGKVKKIVIKKTDNQAEAFISLLPWTFANWLRCTYGEPYPDCDSLTDPEQKTVCTINTQQGRECHMKNLDRYTLEMWVHMPLEGGDVHDVRVEASHWFRDALFRIHAGDEVRFRASLKAELGNVWPVLRLYFVECKSCVEGVKFGSRDLKLKMLESYGIVDNIVDAFRGVWNFMLNPIIKFGTLN